MTTRHHTILSHIVDLLYAQPGARIKKDDIYTKLKETVLRESSIRLRELRYVVDKKLKEAERLGILTVDGNLVYTTVPLNDSISEDRFGCMDYESEDSESDMEHNPCRTKSERSRERLSERDSHGNVIELVCPVRGLIRFQRNENGDLEAVVIKPKRKYGPRKVGYKSQWHRARALAKARRMYHMRKRIIRRR